MTEFLMYDLKVAVLVAVFYMFYRLLLSRETFHRLNRAVLLTTAVASFVLPLCVVTVHQAPLSPPEGGTIEMPMIAHAIEAPSEGTDWPEIVLAGVFLAGMVVTLAYQLSGLVRLWRLIAHSERHPQADGTMVCVTDKPLSPCSWMHYIILSRCDYNSPPFGVQTNGTPFSPPLEGSGDGGPFSLPSEGSGEAFVLAHERGHIRQRHTLDVLLVDTLTALQWFNPAMWMLRQDLRAIHEYEADQAVLSQGINMRQYQYLLIQKAARHCGYSVANGITHSTLKKRINMMLNKKSSRASRLKLLALLPIVGTVLALQARTVTDYVYETPQKKTAVKKGRKAGVIKLPGQNIEVKTDTARTAKGVNVKVLTDKEFLEQPLFIVDGKRVENTDEFVKNLDPATVDHIDVLKDKSATELYDEEGKNGVIIITTKEHAEEKKAVEESEVVVVSYDNEDTDDDDYEKVFDVVEQMPEFPGGPAELMKFLSQNVRYPEDALKTGAQGRVIVSFIVEASGVVGNVKVVKKVNDDLDAEAVRLVGSMPKWTPGKQNGKAVRVKYTMPVTFSLQ